MNRLLRTPCFSLGLLLLPALPSVSFSVNRCATCHPQEVRGYSRSAMSRSLRRPDKEPEGSFEHPLSGTKFTIYSNPKGLWQRMERDGEVSEYRVAYVVGSGNHASGYLVLIGNHLFQSPICYYPKLKRFDMAPGYEENRGPDFIRAVTEECLLCHSGRPRHIRGTLNEYESPEFAQESISCDRCHGDPSKHLKMPLPGSIVNPARLAPAARDSICEQCHLKGLARVLNPTRKFEDFHPDEPMEQVYTTYTAARPPGHTPQGLKVISHAEQLEVSLCARKSNGRLWCGTCHNPHDTSRETGEYYTARCLSCHRPTLAKSHAGGSTGNCVACHMSKRNAKDGGHTVFTDHRISRHQEPEHEKEIYMEGELMAWREPSPALRQRNLALAYAAAAYENGSSAWFVQGFRLLTEVEKDFPKDAAVLTALGQTLLAMKRPLDAAELFERVLQLGQDSAVNESNAGTALMQAGKTEKAVYHLERAVNLDPLLLPAAEVLVQAYRQQGQTDKLELLGDRVREALGSSAPQAPAPQKR